MKKVFACLLAALVLLTGCGKEKEAEKYRYGTMKELAESFLTAVAREDYAAIWDMLPEAIQEWAIEEEIIRDEADGLSYIRYALEDYYWLKEADLPNCESYAVGAIETGEEDANGVWKYLRDEGVQMGVDEAGGCRFTIEKPDGQQVEGSLFAIRTGDRWYLTSVAGDDEIFEY